MPNVSDPGDITPTIQPHLPTAGLDGSKHRTAAEAVPEPELPAVHRVGWGFISLFTLAYTSTFLLFLAPALVTLALKVNSLVGPSADFPGTEDRIQSLAWDRRLLNVLGTRRRRLPAAASAGLQGAPDEGDLKGKSDPGDHFGHQVVAMLGGYGGLQVGWPDDRKQQGGTGSGPSVPPPKPDRADQLGDTAGVDQFGRPAQNTRDERREDGRVCQVC